MYKVFFNDRKIVIARPGKITLNKPSVFFNDFCHFSEVENWFYSFVNQDETETILIHSNPKTFFKNIFQSAFKTIDAAGGVVRYKNEILFILKNKKWDLPKGKIDKGEDSKAAAIREVGEECGITGHQIVKKLPSTYHIFQSPYKENEGEWILKKTFWFEMDYYGEEIPEPQTGEGITEVKWITRDAMDEVYNTTYENLKQIISLYRY